MNPKPPYSHVLSSLDPGRSQAWTPVLRRRDKEIPELALDNFSFIHEPQRTLDSLAAISEIECRAVDAYLHFEDPHCLDVASYLVLADIWPQMLNVFRGGRMPATVQAVVDAIGLRRDLQMRLHPQNDEVDVWAFPKRSRRKLGSSRSENRFIEPQTREKVADELCLTVDAWLAEASNMFELTPQGKARLGFIVGEILDNAERHSDLQNNDGEWSTAAFMTRRKEGEKLVYRCHLGFVSVGATIAESLATAPTSIQDQVNEYWDLHHRCGRSRETLSCLVAMQDGVTRDAEAFASERGGIGLLELLEMINVVGHTLDVENEPRLTIVSGQSCIQVRTPYLRGERSGSDQPRRIWFNETNDPRIAPDQKFVFDLTRKFPGTVIGLTFVFDGEDLRARLDGDRRFG